MMVETTAATAPITQIKGLEASTKPNVNMVHI